MVIDLTLDDEDDGPAVKTEQRNTLQSTATSTLLPQQPENHLVQSTPAVAIDLMKEFSGMMANIVEDFGIDALGQPEARRLRLSMGQAAKSGNKALLCQLFGALDALLQAGQ